MNTSSRKNKLKICMISSEYPPNSGGIGYYVFNIARILNQRGHEVTVITRGNWHQKYSITEENKVTIYRVQFIPLYPFHIKIHGIFIKRLLKDLNLDFDIVHLNTPLVPYIKRLTPYIATQHSVILREINMRKGLDLYSFGYKLLCKPICKIDRTISANASTIIAVSQQKAEELQLFYGIPSEKILTISNGVDSNFFKPADKNYISNPNVLYCGRIDAVKGIGDFVTAAHYINKQRNDVQFIVAGSGIGTLQYSIKKKVEAYNLTSKFHFLGSVSQSELKQYYQSANIYVLPSFYEGIALSLLEAMSCAVPCVATDIPGNAAIIDNGVNGILIEPGKPEILAEKVLMLLDDKQKCMELGNNAREKILKMYDWNIIVDKLEAVYKNNIR